MGRTPPGRHSLSTRVPAFFLFLAATLPALFGGDPVRNAAQAARFYREVWQAHRYDAVDEIFAAEYVNHDPRDPDPRARAEGRKAPRESQKELARRQSHSGSGRVDFQLSSGDHVTTRWFWKTRLDGWWERLVAGRDAVEIPIVQIFRFDQEGRVVEVWNQRDDLGVQEQMRLTGLYYFEGVLFGAALMFAASRLLGRKKAWPGPPPPPSSQPQAEA